MHADHRDARPRECRRIRPAAVSGRSARSPDLDLPRLEADSQDRLTELHHVPHLDRLLAAQVALNSDLVPAGRVDLAHDLRDARLDLVAIADIQTTERGADALAEQSLTRLSDFSVE